MVHHKMQRVGQTVVQFNTLQYFCIINNQIVIKIGRFWSGGRVWVCPLLCFSGAGLMPGVSNHLRVWLCSWFCLSGSAGELIARGAIKLLEVNVQCFSDRKCPLKARRGPFTIYHRPSASGTHCTRSASRNACPEAVIHGQWSAGGHYRQQWPTTGPPLDPFMAR